jgi:hypothetical protein
MSGMQYFWFEQGPGADMRKEQRSLRRLEKEPRANSRSCYCLPPAAPSMVREAVVLGVAAAAALGGPFSSAAE